MKQNELRLGNLVIKKGETEPMLATPAVIEFADLFDPIPLTEEWLVRLGFEEQSEYPQTWNKGEVALWYYPERPSVMLHLCKPNSFNYRYVHQLQNLVYSLSGEELCVS